MWHLFALASFSTVHILHCQEWVAVDDCALEAAAVVVVAAESEAAAVAGCEVRPLPMFIAALPIEGAGGGAGAALVRKEEEPEGFTEPQASHV